MSKRFPIFFSLFFFSALSMLHAQVVPVDSGKIEIVQEQKIARLLQMHADINAKADVRGYRVKIHFGADKLRAKEVKARFMSKFPDIPAYEKYDQPNFNIRVGDFRTKLEAYRLLKEIQFEFPGAFIVQDDIELPQLDIPVTEEAKKGN